MKDWDKELAKIDRQLGTLPDEALLPARQSGGSPAPGTTPAPSAGVRETTTAGVLARLGLVLAMGVGMYFWPYPTRCGAGLFGYLAAAGVVTIGGAWSAIWSWRHRASLAHILSLALMLWGGALAAREVLPRVGYAIPTEAHPAVWMCE